jgi:hypothetical protein
MVNRYPYPFVYVADLGYGQTVLDSLGLLFVFVAGVFNGRAGSSAST